MKITRIGAMVLAVLTALAPGQIASAAQTPCLPPGVAGDVLQWHTADARAIGFPTESGPARAGLLEVYQSGDGRSAVLVWVRGAIVYVDAAPENPGSPAWVDAGVVSPNGKMLLDNPAAPCQWRILGGQETRLRSQ